MSLVSLSMWRGKIRHRISMAQILQKVADSYGFSVEVLKGPERSKGVCIARQHAMWLMRQQPHLSFPQIGRFLGGRDHTTILHGVRCHEKRMAEGTAYHLETAA